MKFSCVLSLYLRTNPGVHIKRQMRAIVVRVLYNPVPFYPNISEIYISFSLTWSSALQDIRIVCAYDRTYSCKKQVREMEESEDKMEQFPHISSSLISSHGVGTHFYSDTEK